MHQPEMLFEHERPYLVRLCTWLTGDPDLAEDLAQETLLIAWQHHQRLRDQARQKQWLAGIARNLCRHWLRRQQKLLSQNVVSAEHSPIESLPDAFDLEIELERHELAELLDRALALLPPPTRTVLFERYLREMPQAELAQRLGVSEGAIEARIQRGKLALRRVLTTVLWEEAAAYGVCAGNNLGWQSTRIWCPSCGVRRFVGRIDPESTQHLQLRCDCGANFVRTSPPAAFDALRGFRTSFSRLARWHTGYFQPHLSSGVVPCANCGHPTTLHRAANTQLPPAFVRLPPALPGTYGFWINCTTCDSWSYQSDVTAIALFLPETQRFWRAHPRMRALPPRLSEAGSGPILVTGFQDMAGPACLEISFDRASLSLLTLKSTTHT